MPAAVDAGLAAAGLAGGDAVCHLSRAAGAGAAADGEDPDACCWICLAGEAEGPLVHPCACPKRVAHRACLARWQLTSAGRE